MKKRISISPYDGAKPYVFLCFSDSDTEEAVSLMTRLRQRGCRTAYTVGCSRNTLEETDRSRMMKNAGLVIALVSDSFQNDPYVKGNVLYLQAAGKPVILVKRSRDITALSLGLREDTPSVDAFGGIDDDVEASLICSQGFSHAFLGEFREEKHSISLFRISAVMIAVSAAVLLFAVLCIKTGLYAPKTEEDPLSVVELTLTEIPSDIFELDQYPNLEKLRIPQSRASEAEMLLDRYTIVLYEEGRK